jgi:hypothetical protein
LSNPSNAVVWSHDSSLWSKIELAISSPLFYFHTTLDPTVASDFLDDKMRTKQGTPSPFTPSTPSALSSFTPFSANSPNQITFTTTTLSTNMLTIPPKMPARGHHSVPKFEGTAHLLNQFFSDFEYQADISQLDEAQKKQMLSNTSQLSKQTSGCKGRNGRHFSNMG